MVEKKERKATTVLLTSELQKKLDECLDARKREDPRVKQANLIRAALEQYLKAPIPPPWQRKDSPIRLNEIRKHIVEAVTSNLRTHTEWAEHTVQDMLLLAEGGSVFAERMEHFLDEKRFLANMLVGWLIERILFFLKEGYSIYLVIDSGTSLYWVFRSLDEKLKEKLRTDKGTRDLLKHFVILTNNTAGAFSYIAASNEDKSDADRSGGGEEEVILADNIKCHVLGGEIVTRYAATLGPETVASLRHARERASGSKHKFIGLLAGQWVRLDEKDRHPIALARGFGQSAFKREMLLSDEVYLISPLGKIFHLPYGEVCEGLRKDASRKSYVDVGVVEAEEQGEGESEYWENNREQFQDRSKKVRLVTTFRTKRDQALCSHSQMVQTLCDKWWQPDADDKSAGNDFSLMPHFQFPFDLPFGLSEPERQCEIEFPHVRPVGERARPSDIRLDFVKKAFMLNGVFAEWTGPQKRK